MSKTRGPDGLTANQRAVVAAARHHHPAGRARAVARALDECGMPSETWHRHADRLEGQR